MRRYLLGILAVLSCASASFAGARSSQLIAAVKADDVRAVRAVLVQRPDVNAREANGMTALHWAVQGNSAPIVDALLAAGADVHAVTEYGIRPLSIAAINGNAEILGRLLKAGAKPDVAMADGVTPLMSVARNGSPAAIRALLAAGAKVDERETRREQTALMWASAEGNVAAIRILAEAGADLNAHSKMRPVRPTRAPEPAAPKAYDAEAVEAGGNELVLRAQFPKGRDVSLGAFQTRTVTEGLTPLLFAVREGHADAVKVLLDAGARLEEPASDGTTPLYMAIVNAHWELAASLLDRGANPNTNARGITPLIQLASTRRLNWGHLQHPQPTGSITSIDLAKKLVAKGADVNARMTVSSMGDGYRNRMNRKGATAFLIAAKGLDPEMMKLLVSLGADPTIPNAENATAIMFAAGLAQYNPLEDDGTEEESLEAVKFCVSLGLDVNAVDDNGETALHGAAYKGYNSVVQYLVDRGAKLDAKNVLGWTPLTITKGVMYTALYKSQRHTAALLVKLMRERGMEASDAVDVTGAGYVKDAKLADSIGAPAADATR